MYQYDKQLVKGTVVFLVKTGITDLKRRQIVHEIFGQLSDGYWENNSRYDKVWKQVEYDQKNDVLIVTRDINCCRTAAPFEDGTQLCKWIAQKIRFLTKVWFDHHKNDLADGETFDSAWNKRSDRVISYFSYPMDVTVDDIRGTCEELRAVPSSACQKVSDNY